MERSLSPWITDYLCWMIDQGYSSYTVDAYEKILRRFEEYVAQKEAIAHQAFSQVFLEVFFESCGASRARAALGGFMLFLDKEGIASFKKASPDLPPLFKGYLNYHHRAREVTRKRQTNICKVLRDFNAYLDRGHITMEDLRIEDVEGFLREVNQNLSFKSRQDKKAILRGFLRYLHDEKRLLKKDLSQHLKSAPVFNRDNPPKYLRPDELKRLFDGALSPSPRGLQANAMARLAFTTGLRPCEIARIGLDDISFKNAELRVPARKGFNPAVFPLPEDTIKVIAAYIIGARPKSSGRDLFLALDPPHGPVSSSTVQRSIACLMKKASVPGTPYWLRHTYAQNLLESGASFSRSRKCWAMPA